MIFNSISGGGTEPYDSFCDTSETQGVTDPSTIEFDVVAEPKQFALMYCPYNGAIVGAMTNNTAYVLAYQKGGDLDIGLLLNTNTGSPSMAIFTGVETSYNSGTGKFSISATGKKFRGVYGTEMGYKLMYTI